MLWLVNQNNSSSWTFSEGSLKELLLLFYCITNICPSDEEDRRNRVRTSAQVNFHRIFCFMEYVLTELLQLFVATMHSQLIYNRRLGQIFPSQTVAIA